MTSGDNCPICGGSINANEGTCSICGTVFTAPEPVECPDCGNIVPQGENICNECGTRIGMASDDEYETIEEPDEEEIILSEPDPDMDIDDLNLSGTFDPENIDKEMEDLLKLPGVGPLRAEILLGAGYGDLRKLKRASVMELVKIKGIGRKSAGEIKTALRDIDLEEIRSKELDLAQIEEENACPLCNTIVSSFEFRCYECGTTLRDHQEQGADGDDPDVMALAYYDTKLKEDPSNKELWYARGSTLMKMEEFDMALASFDKSLEIDDGYQNAWISKAEVYNKMSEPMKAADCYSHVISSQGFELPSYEDIDDLDDGEMSDTDVLEAIQPSTIESGSLEDVEDDDILSDVPENEEVDDPTEEETTTYETVEEFQETEEPEVAAPEFIEEEVPEEEVIYETVEEEIPEEEVIYETVEEEVPEEEVIYETVEEEEVPEEEEIVEETIEVMEAEPEPEPEEDPKVLKRSLAIHAGAIKPLLLLAKELSIDVLPQKKIIAQGVNESKKQNLHGAVALMKQGRRQIEEAFVNKANEDLGLIAQMARDMKIQGQNVDRIIDSVSMAKKLLEERKFKESFDKMNECLAMVENIKAGY